MARAHSLGPQNILNGLTTERVAQVTSEQVVLLAVPMDVFQALSVEAARRGMGLASLLQFAVAKFLDETGKESG